MKRIRRTFIDKLFAIADYYLSDKTNEHSRHLYDIFKISSVIELNEDLKQLLAQVRDERKNHKTCLSAQDDINLKNCLQEIIDQDVYKKDYERITIPLIFEQTSYDTVIQNLQEIVNGNLFDS